MVGIFSRFSAGRRSGHRRTKSATETRETVGPTVEVGGSSSAGNDHEIDVTVDFKPIEHPTEPLNHDRPVTCPLPDPSILNEGRGWKERMSSSLNAGNTSVKSGLPIAKQDSHAEVQASPKHLVLGSISAPEHHLIAMPEDINAAQNQTAH
ncbi:hypothetical protein Cni_G18274 [Canna indica]|uniref:Uncharacterized protein n=1 Tax=Canna indica TaxID=4628 RepID=A0AAQ3KP79_9LILI|nr:hypothetical protein Cni_G18274 [Canna indica]